MDDSDDITLNGEIDEEGDNTTSLEEGQLYDFITNEPVKDKPVERTLQAVARSLVDEYGFDHTQLARDQVLGYQIITDEGKTRRVHQKLNITVYPEGVKKEDTDQIIRVYLIQPPNTKPRNRKKGTFLLEEVMGALPNCDYGLWTKGGVETTAHY